MPAINTYIRASRGRRLWWRRTLQCRIVPTLHHLLHPGSASTKDVPHPLPFVWGEAGGLWGKWWFYHLWLLPLLGGRQHQLDSPLQYEVPPIIIIMIYKTQSQCGERLSHGVDTNLCSWFNCPAGRLDQCNKAHCWNHPRLILSLKVKRFIRGSVLWSRTPWGSCMRDTWWWILCSHWRRNLQYQTQLCDKV